MRDEQRPPHWSPRQFADCLFVQRVRTEADRQALLALYDAHGPEAAELSAGDHPCELSAGDHPCELSAGDHPSEPEAKAASVALQGAASASVALQPSYSVGRRWLQVGHAWLERGAGQLPETAPLQVGLGLGFA